jgi:MFS family permease
VFLGPLAGALSDRLPRARLLAAAALVKTVVLVAIGVAVLTGHDSVPLLFTLVAVSGATMAFQISSLQALAADTVGRDRLASAVSLTSFGQRSVGAAGAIGGGLLIGTLGPGPTFLLAVVPVAAAAAIYARLPVGGRRVASQPLLSDVADGLRLLVTVRLVSVLLGLMVVVEILGFSYHSLLPVIATAVLDVGPLGLGTLVSAAAVGSLAGTGALTLMADMRHKGPLLVGVVFTFGLLLVALAGSDRFMLSIVIIAGIGAMAAMVDALEWILLQASVPDNMRGRVLGGWNLAIGIGVIGPISLGALADAAGVQWAIGASGALLAAAAITIAIGARRLREV